MKFRSEIHKNISLCQIKHPRNPLFFATLPPIHMHNPPRVELRRISTQQNHTTKSSAPHTQLEHGECFTPANIWNSIDKSKEAREEGRRECPTWKKWREEEKITKLKRSLRERKFLRSMGSSSLETWRGEVSLDCLA